MCVRTLQVEGETRLRVRETSARSRQTKRYLFEVIGILAVEAWSSAL